METQLMTLWLSRQNMGERVEANGKGVCDGCYAGTNALSEAIRARIVRGTSECSPEGGEK